MDPTVELKEELEAVRGVMSLLIKALLYTAPETAALLAELSEDVDERFRHRVTRLINMGLHEGIPDKPHLKTNNWQAGVELVLTAMLIIMEMSDPKGFEALTGYLGELQQQRDKRLAAEKDPERIRIPSTEAICDVVENIFGQQGKSIGGTTH